MHCLNVITSSAYQHLWLSVSMHLCVRTQSANNGKGSMEQNSSYKVHKVSQSPQSLTKSTSRESRLTSSKPARWSDDAYTQAQWKRLGLKTMKQGLGSWVCFIECPRKRRVWKGGVLIVRILFAKSQVLLPMRMLDMKIVRHPSKSSWIVSIKFDQ